MLKLRSNYLRSFLLPLLLLAAVGGSGCQTTKTAGTGILVEQPLVPEPLPVSYRTEIAIARISELLQSTEITPEQRARLYYDRGVMFDSAGLSSLARIDFMRALRVKPDMADAYNFIGIHQTLSGDYEAAYESFDSALELDPQYQYVFLNRAIALAYDGKIELALKDFQSFVDIQPEDPYRVLWLFLAQMEVSPEQAKAQLARQLPQLDEKKWAHHIARFYLGQINEAELLSIASTNVPDAKQLAEQLCEVYFYLARWHGLQNNPTQAVEYYKLVLATNVFEFVEHRYARIEMAKLRQQVIHNGTVTPDLEDVHTH